MEGVVPPLVLLAFLQLRTKEYHYVPDEVMNLYFDNAPTLKRHPFKLQPQWQGIRYSTETKPRVLPLNIQWRPTGDIAWTKWRG